MLREGQYEKKIRFEKILMFTDKKKEKKESLRVKTFHLLHCNLFCSPKSKNIFTHFLNNEMKII